jgi:cytoskeletal protein RodZ
LDDYVENFEKPSRHMLKMLETLVVIMGFFLLVGLWWLELAAIATTAHFSLQQCCVYNTCNY